MYVILNNYFILILRIRIIINSLLKIILLAYTILIWTTSCPTLYNLLLFRLRLLLFKRINLSELCSLSKLITINCEIWTKSSFTVFLLRNSIIYILYILNILLNELFLAFTFRFLNNTSTVYR